MEQQQDNPGEINKLTDHPWRAPEMLNAATGNHRIAAAHQRQAAWHNIEAARHQESGNIEQAAQCTRLAMCHEAIADDLSTGHLKEGAR